jgi:hypothetical protein
MENKHIGFPWFHRKNYEKLLNIFTDCHLMPKTYDEWLKFAEEGIDRLSCDGFTIEIVYIDPKTFPSWCRVNRLDLDGKARIAFADDYVARKYFKNHV